MMEGQFYENITYPTVPLNEMNVVEYLTDVIKFLAEYSWIYETKNTDIFISDVLQKIPKEWITALQDLTFEEQKQIPYNMFKSEWVSSLKYFIKKANVLAAYRNPQETPNNFLNDKIYIPYFIKKGTTIKKLEQIKNLAAIIWKVCDEYKCGTVLDIGSGLGFLDQILHHNFGLTTIGLESIALRTLAAKARICEGTCLRNMYHETKTVENTPECLDYIKKLLENVNKNQTACACGILSRNTGKQTEGVVMVGLHTCGSFAQNMMKLFISLPTVKAIVFAGCCYNQINLEDFPMSSVARNVLLFYQENFSPWSPCKPGLRLGCQLTRVDYFQRTPDEHASHQRHLSYRAILQCLFEKENLKWQKPKRHLRNKNVLSFDVFINSMFQNTNWTELEKERRFKFLHQLYQEKQALFPMVEILSLLQVLLQPVWEGFIIADRIAYFKEHSIPLQVYLMCDELVSPRNVVLCGIK